MSEQTPPAEYLVIARGQWDKTLPQDQIQNVIDQFYTWYDRLIDEGKMKRGQRLTYVAWVFPAKVYSAGVVAFEALEAEIGEGANFKPRKS